MTPRGLPAGNQVSRSGAPMRQRALGCLPGPKIRLAEAAQPGSARRRACRVQWSSHSDRDCQSRCPSQCERPAARRTRSGVQAESLSTVTVAVGDSKSDSTVTEPRPGARGPARGRRGPGGRAREARAPGPVGNLNNGPNPTAAARRRYASDSDRVGWSRVPRCPGGPGPGPSGRAARHWQAGPAPVPSQVGTELTRNLPS